MKKKAIIAVSSNANDSDEKEIEVVTPGDYYKEGDYYYAVYDETELSGMEGTRTTLKISIDELILKREGTTNTNMVFRENLDDIILYDTPYGVLELKIMTRDLKIDIGDDGADVIIDYDVAVAGQKPQNTILKIKIKS